ncbi:hypothetical protein MML48_7g00007001 [Holotrichia oblita]|uniref:Uncharacterized protein n=1 Tax=Holotrichia oblita TaxID=644536 RepID=A0ACB9STJ7_HOLOL|nr:hypothetical protein MML48_7g00007001 [Holotrichia oblita]
MRSQKVGVDAWKMVTSSIAYLGIAFLAWVFVKLLYACFWLPAHFDNEDEEELIDKEEMEEYEKLEEDNHQEIFNDEDQPQEDKKTV